MYIIAEIAQAHDGSLGNALAFIKQAKTCGADAVKFQLWNPNNLAPGEWDNDGRRQIYEKAELSIEDHEYLIDVCKKYRIHFLSSCFSVEDARLLKNLNQKKIKIPSMEIRNHRLIQFCIDEFDYLFISTGTANKEDLENLQRLLGNKKSTVMHCVSSYPCNPENANLPRIKLLYEIFNDVGYSDHVSGINASIGSLEFEVSHIEKHFTIDNSLPGRDNKFAILPEQLLFLTDYIKNRKLFNKHHGIDFQECEKGTRIEYSGRFSNY